MSTDIAPKEATAVATQSNHGEIVSASFSLGQRLGIQPREMINVIKAHCFKSVPYDKITNEMLAAFVNVANSLEINPMLPGMLYAYPSKNGGIECIIGPDCVFKKVCEIPDYDGRDEPEYEYGPKGELIACTVRLYFKRWSRPVSRRVLFKEWYRDTPTWKSIPEQMLFVRGFKHCAREILHGLPLDQEEYEMVQAHASIKVTPKAAAASLAADLQELTPAKPIPQDAPAPREVEIDAPDSFLPDDDPDTTFK